MARKHIVLVLVLFFLNLFLLYGSCEEEKPNAKISLSLQDVITIAFKNNKDIQIQEQEIKVAWFA
jgi:hypothetical protein